MIPKDSGLTVVQVNYAFDPALPDADALLESYRTLTGWSEALRSRGCEVTVVQRFHRRGDIVRNGIAYRLRTSVSEVNREAAASTPEVAHINGLEFASEGRRLRRRLPRHTALVIQDHASALPASRPAGPLRRVQFALRRRALRAADAFLFVTAEQARPWRQLGLISPEQPVYEVLEGSTTIEPVDRGEARLATGMIGQPALLWVGRLNANKDPLTVLEAFHRFLAVHRQATLAMIFSDDELLPLVKAQLASKPTLGASTTLVGRVPFERMAAYYSAADLFVLGSHREGSGYALIEACTCGALPVVSDIPPFRSITADGRFGDLWPAGDAEACLRALLAAAQRDLGATREQVRAHAVERLSWKAIGGRAVEAYRNILGRANRSRKC